MPDRVGVHPVTDRLVRPVENLGPEPKHCLLGGVYIVHQQIEVQLLWCVGR